MPSLRARIVNLLLPRLGIKRFFSEPDKIPGRIAKMRNTAPARPGAKMHRKFAIKEFASRGFPVITIEPKHGATPGAPHLLYLHGGGYVMDAAVIHWSAIGRLCEALGASATVPLYPLAPESTASATLPAMRSVFAELALRYGAQNITLMGDSAGGGMALALAQILAADGAAMPGSLVLFSPWLDATASGEGQAEIEPRDKMLTCAGLTACGALYAGDLPLTDPQVSPLFGSLKALPPMAVFAGTSDILLPDARRLAVRLDEAGRKDCVYHEYDAMFHVWMLFPVPEGRKALAQAVDFIRAQHKKG
ncbi:alpha/beta hydrolase fold domain-containing protein [Qipengyuania marisflavi]|uniref:Alpha/beta hydrolase n=1 Tax=Qipengyuania marisflavi TaxID=2486356 RepID=A0A5S3P3W2_9SPHN|nr:alpha/beta hydrolase [Qipengyuania marisflavi]TMM46721.1 alpha/beta hydrolase [Qipengyuania marisflavi]